MFHSDGSKGSVKERVVLEVRNLIKNYGARGICTQALKGIDLTIAENDFIAVMGPSGSGKTTLLNMLSFIDRPTQGQIILSGRNIAGLSNQELSGLRRNKVGYVFQDYNLLDTMTLQDNIALPLALNGVSAAECIRRTEEFGRMFGLEGQLDKYPCQLSGGQKQKGAACRALVTQPEILFADEPTGALDTESGKELLTCFRMLNDRLQATIFMATHDAYAASWAKDVYFLDDGRVKCRLSRGSSRRELYDRIMEVQASMGGRRA